MLAIIFPQDLFCEIGKFSPLKITACMYGNLHVLYQGTYHCHCDCMLHVIIHHVSDHPGHINQCFVTS